MAAAGGLHSAQRMKCIEPRRTQMPVPRLQNQANGPDHPHISEPHGQFCNPCFGRDLRQHSEQPDRQRRINGRNLRVRHARPQRLVSNPVQRRTGGRVQIRVEARPSNMTFPEVTKYIIGEAGGTEHQDKANKERDCNQMPKPHLGAREYPDEPAPQHQDRNG